MYAFKENLEGQISQAPPPPLNGSENPEVQKVELKHPRQYFSVDKYTVNKTAELLNAVSDLNMDRIRQYGVDTSEKLAQLFDVENPYIGLEALKEEYIRNAAVNGTQDLSRLGMGPRRPRFPSYMCNDVIDVLENNEKIQTTINDIISHTTDDNEVKNTYIRYLLARDIRTLEILLSNKNLINNNKDNINNLLRAIYITYGVSHDFYDEEITSVCDYYTGLMKNLIQTVNSTGILFGVKSLINDYNVRSVRFSHVFSNLEFTRKIMIYHSAAFQRENNKLVGVATLYYTLKRDDQTAPVTVQTEGKYKFRLVKERLPGVDVRLIEQYENDDLPCHALYYKVKDSKEVAIPMFGVTTEFLTHALLIPSTTQVMEYMKKQYGLPIVDPYSRYGKYTQFLIQPESNGFLNVLMQRINVPLNNWDTVDIKSYLKEQEPEEHPSPFDEWFRVHLPQIELTKTAKEVIYGKPY